jgi:tRNA pseudouridine synthase 10
MIFIEKRIFMKVMKEKIEKVLSSGYICDNCLGRILAGQLLSGFDNKRRGRVIRLFTAMLLDSGEKLKVDLSNFYGIKFRNLKIKIEKPKSCKICKNFFQERIDEIVKRIIKKIDNIEFDTFLVGSISEDEMIREEEKIFERIGIEFAEIIKSEINREVGKKIEKITKKKFSPKNPDLTIIINLNTNSIRLQIKSIYIYGEYQKLVRGIPQSKWICGRCGGKGCINCKGRGKLYPTSVQEIIEKPLLMLSKAKKSAFHGAGREDIDARTLDYRPFVIELKKPKKRMLKLRKIQEIINKSRKVKVRKLRFVERYVIRKIKNERWDKTYLALVKFEKNIDEKKLKMLKVLTEEPILQKTPLRVLHRRSDKVRKRRVKKISWKILNRKTLQLKIRAESGLYIKELITGDEGRTKPNISEILGNKVKKISLDVIKIHNK